MLSPCPSVSGKDFSSFSYAKIIIIISGLLVESGSSLPSS